MPQMYKAWSENCVILELLVNRGNINSWLFHLNESNKYKVSDIPVFKFLCDSGIKYSKCPCKGRHTTSTAHNPWEILEAILAVNSLVKMEIRYWARIAKTGKFYVTGKGRRVNEWRNGKKTEKGKYFWWHNNKIFSCRPEPLIGLNFKQISLPAEYWPNGKWQPLHSLIYTQMKRFWVPDTRKPVLLTLPPCNL